MSFNSTDYREYFKKVTGFYPYNFQTELSKTFLNYHSIILQAPTGSGKTWASIVPFIYAWKEWKNGNQKVEECPRKLIYSLPLRTLANSLFEELKTKLDTNVPDLNISVTLQTGENPKDRFFEGDIVFTTIDQTLSNVLSIPLSLPKKLANINAGAVLSSYLVFDEFHLLDPKRSLSTTLILLKMMETLTHFCLMTATLTDDFSKHTAEYLNAKIVRVGETDYSNFEFVKKKADKRIQINESPLSSSGIWRAHKKKSIVICNTVDRCIALYKELKALKEKNKKSTEILCIHSQFFQRDRKEKEKRIIELFGKNSQSDAILVSTQVVEVGLDISCDVMHTEISPINSFLQRIGRCARWEGDGKIFVYDIDPERGTYKPYNEQLSKDTLLALTKNQNKNIDHFLSQELIQNVLQKLENQIFDEIQNNSNITNENIKTAWLTGGKEKARELIRFINSVSVVMLPENTKTDSLYKYESLSINPFTLKKKIEIVTNELEGNIPNYVFSLEESNFDYDEQRVLQPIQAENIPMQNIVALNSDFVGYNPEFGLDFENSKRIQSQIVEKIGQSSYPIHRDTYEEHIDWMVEFFSKDYCHYYTLSRIQNNYFLEFDLETLLKYILVMHDYGKLSQKWQSITNNYQKAKFKSEDKEWQTAFLAHTDFDPKNSEDRRLEKQFGDRPDHAGVGAVISFKTMPQLLKWRKYSDAQSLLKVVITAILRHHAAFTDHSPDYKIDKKAVLMVETLLEKYIPSLNKEVFDNPIFITGTRQDLKPLEIQFQDPLESFLYFIFVRLLRLSDQHSFKLNPLYEKEK